MFNISGTAVFEIPFLIININGLFMVTVNHLSVCQLARHQLVMLDSILVHNRWISSALRLTFVSQGYSSSARLESHLNLPRFPQSLLVIL